MRVLCGVPLGRIKGVQKGAPAACFGRSGPCAGRSRYSPSESSGASATSPTSRQPCDGPASPAKAGWRLIGGTSRRRVLSRTAHPPRSTALNRLSTESPTRRALPQTPEPRDPHAGPGARRRGSWFPQAASAPSISPRSQSLSAVSSSAMGSFRLLRLPFFR